MVFLIVFGVIVGGAFAIIAFVEVKDWIAEIKTNATKTNPTSIIS